MELKWKLHQYSFNHEQYTETPITAQRFTVMDVHRGTLVAFVAVRVTEAFADITTLEVGDDGEDAGFGLVAETSETLQNLIGKYLCTQYADTINANGKLYTTDDKLEIVLTPSGAQNVGQMIVYVVYAEIE